MVTSSSSSSAVATPTSDTLASSTSSHSHTGAIVGGVVGGVGGFLVLALLGFLALRNRSRRRGGAESGMCASLRLTFTHIYHTGVLIADPMFF